MHNSTVNRLTLLALLLPLGAACLPLGDLDSAGSGKAAGGAATSERGTGDSSAGQSAGGSSGAQVSAGSGALDANAAGSAARAGNGGEQAAGSSTGLAGDGAVSVGGAASAGSPASGGGPPSDVGEAGASVGFVTDLPNDLPNSPVQGNVSCVEASFLEQPTFEVRTPGVTFTVRRASGDIISITDRLSTRQVEWLGYNDYRPRRTAGVVTEQRQQPHVGTNLDTDSVTARHIRLRSESAAGDWLWVWDFYPTQATLTVSRAPGRFGVLYSGTPGGQLDDSDQIVFSSGATQSAKDSFLAPLPEGGTWLYFADPALHHSLFLIQHRSSTLRNRYETVDADSATLLFGDGQISEIPSRFSLGLVDHTDLRSVSDRAEFVIGAVQ